MSISGDGKSIAAMQRQDTHFVALHGPPDAVPRRNLRGFLRTTRFAKLCGTKRMQPAGGNASLDCAHLARRKSSEHCIDRTQRRTFHRERLPDGVPDLVNWASRNNTGKLNIWRVDADGSHPKQLTNGVDDESPVCAADGKSFYYADLDKKSVVNRMSIDGGTPELIKASAITNGFLSTVSDNTSPDGNWRS